MEFNFDLDGPNMRNKCTYSQLFFACHLLLAHMLIGCHAILTLEIEWTEIECSHSTYDGITVRFKPITAGR